MAVPKYLSISFQIIISFAHEKCILPKHFKSNLSGFTWKHVFNGFGELLSLT